MRMTIRSMIIVVVEISIWNFENRAFLFFERGLLRAALLVSKITRVNKEMKEGDSSVLETGDELLG